MNSARAQRVMTRVSLVTTRIDDELFWKERHKQAHGEGGLGPGENEACAAIAEEHRCQPEKDR